MNKVMLIGNLGGDPEKRFTPAGQPVTTFNIATTERWKDRANGQPQERTEWHRIVVWGQQAENCAQYLAKGRSVYVEGRLQTRQWEDKEGKKRYTTEIVATRVLFLGSQGAGDRRGSTGAESQDTEFSGTAPTPGFDPAAGGTAAGGGGDDVPF
jgi:single-strand DNA-binding protein